MSLLDDLLKGIGNAVNDVREKVVEEPLFGRVVSTNMQTPEATTVSVRASDDPAPAALDATQSGMPPEATPRRETGPEPEL